MSRTDHLIPVFNFLILLRINAASSIIEEIHNPNDPKNASDAATMKNIKNSVDKLNCMV
jgi:hypothetical protein